MMFLVIIVAAMSSERFPEWLLSQECLFLVGTDLGCTIAIVENSINERESKGFFIPIGKRWKEFDKQSSSL